MSASLQSHFKLHPSRYLVFFIFIACIFSLVASYSFPLGMIAYTVLSLLILAACALIYFRDAKLKLANSCVAFRIDSDDSIALMLRDGRHQAGNMVAGGVVLPFIVLINVRFESGGRRRLVLLRDSMDDDSFRRLRVLLRWGVK